MGDEDFDAGEEEGEYKESGDPVGDADEGGVAGGGHGDMLAEWLLVVSIILCNVNGSNSPTKFEKLVKCREGLKMAASRTAGEIRFG